MKEKIYLITGLMTDKRLWSRLKQYLEDKYELIYLPIPLTNSFDIASKQLETVIKDENINLLGFSLGAYLASYFTIQNPSKVKKLFLLSGTCGAMQEDEIIKRKMALNQMEKFGFRGLSIKMVLSLLEEKNHKDEELINLIKEMFKDSGQDAYKLQMELTFNRVDISSNLKDLDIPIKFFYSSKDELLNYEVFNNFTNDDKHITLTSQESTSHMIPLEEPVKLANEIEKWMK